MPKALRKLVQGLGVLWGSATLVFSSFPKCLIPPERLLAKTNASKPWRPSGSCTGCALAVFRALPPILGRLSPLGPLDDGSWGLRSNRSQLLRGASGD